MSCKLLLCNRVNIIVSSYSDINTLYVPTRCAKLVVRWKDEREEPVVSGIRTRGESTFSEIAEIERNFLFLNIEIEKKTYTKSMTK